MNPAGTCRYCLHPEHPSGTMCSMHPALLKERMEPYAFTGEPLEVEPQSEWEKCCTDIKINLMARIEQLEAQLAGCLSAAEGYQSECKQGDYGWSPAYQAIINLPKGVRNDESC